MSIRSQIDTVDTAILELLAQRAALVGQLWEEKAAQGIPLKDPARETMLFSSIRLQASALGLDPDKVEQLFHQIVGVDLRAG